MTPNMIAATITNDPDINNDIILSEGFLQWVKSKFGKRTKKIEDLSLQELSVLVDRYVELLSKKYPDPKRTP